MKFIFVSNYCSQKTYFRLLEPKFRTSQQYQKYMRLIASGLDKNGFDVETIAIPPINSHNIKRKIVRLRPDKEYGILFHYVNLINIPIIRNLVGFIKVFFYVLKFGMKNKNVVFVQDMLNVTSTIATYLGCKLTHNKIIGILTDMPNAYVDNENGSVPIHKKIAQKLCKKCPNAYLFINDAMNKVVNEHNKPYVVIEGFSDVAMQNRDNNVANKYNPKVCMYAGGINKLYGLDMLVEGFIQSDMEECELHIYGDGPYVPELKKICSLHGNIKYFGVLNNDEIVKEEEKASLLINPRYTHSEFVKYSFPSKNIEYMASGTPVLTTDLPGMPTEYRKYVYILKNENAHDLALMLSSILKQTDKELNEFGIQAKEWIMYNKNNVVATKKIIDLSRMILKEENY